MSKLSYIVAGRVRIRWKRVVAAGGVLLMLLSFPLLSWLLRSGMDQALLTRVLSEAAGMEVQFDSYSLGWAGQAHLKGLKVHLAEEELLAADGLQASFSWWSLLQRQPEVSDLRLESPHLTLSDSRLERLRQRPQGEGSELALDFENASVTYLGPEGPLKLERLDGRYTEGQVEVAQQESFQGNISWDQQAHHYRFEGVPLKLIGELSGRSLPEGKVDLDFQQQANAFQGSMNLESGLASGQANLAFELNEPVVKGVLEGKQWTVAGHQLGAAQVPFQWDGETLEVQQASVTTEPGGKLTLEGRLSSRLANLSVTRGPLVLALKGTEAPFALAASWDGVPVVEGTLTPEPWTLKVANLNGGYLMRLSGVEGVGFDFVGELVWKDGLLGSLSSPGGQLQGQKVGQTRLDLSADRSGEVQLLGTSMVAKQPLELKAERKGSIWSLTASAQKVPAALFQPGRGGTVDLTANASYPGNSANFDFVYSGDKEIPALDGRGSLQKQVVSFQALRLPKLSPPLVAQGTYALADGKLSLEAKLEGQQLSSLWAASPVTGKLYGTARLKGTSSRPLPSFQGNVKETRWQGADFGTVAVTASNSSMKATLSDFSLGRIPTLKPYLSGSGTVELEGLPPNLSASASFPSVKFKEQDLGSVKARLRLKGETLVVESMTLPEANLSGTVSSKSLKLAGRIEGLKLERLPLPSKASGKAFGDFSVSGTPDKPQGSFQGKVQNLVYKETALGDLPLDASFTGTTVKVKALGIQVEKLPAVVSALPELKGVLQVGLTLDEKPHVVALLEKGKYAGKSLPPVSAALSWDDKVVKLQKLTLEQETPLTLQGTFLPQEGTFSLGSSFDRVDLGPVLALLPQRPPLDGRITGQMTIKGTRSSAELDFKGSGQGFNVSGVSVGGIPQLNLAATSQGDFMLQADGLSASSISPLQGLYPGLQGKVSFRASRDPKTAQIGLSGKLVEATIPDLNVRANWTGSELKLESLQAAVSPPLVLSGTVKEGQLNIAGELGGQPLSVLMPLGGSKPPSDIRANLGGSFRLSGPVSNPTASLVGPVTNLVYRTSQLGSGRLQLTVNQRLSGELNLDNPYDATLADAAPGSVVQIPLVSDILKSAVKARISGVKIAGTPSDPQVTPVVVGVGVAQQKLQVPNLPQVQQRLPGVLEQNGVKLPDLGNGGARIEIPGTGQAIKIKL